MFSRLFAHKIRQGSLCASTALALSLVLGAVAPATVHAAAANVAIERQPLGDALMKLSLQTRTSIYFRTDMVAGKTAPAISGNLTAQAALDRMLKGTGLAYTVGKTGNIDIIAKPQEQVVKTAATVRPSTSTTRPVETVEEPLVQEVIVTARRRQEKIIDVPVSVSAFSAQQLDERKVEGGSELLRVIPNVNFSKDNFTSYNFSIRGIGTKATSVTTDPAVAVSFNNTALLRNRLFEQEYFDVERLEVLRGPQGTLYGRNATAGVVNMLPNLPELQNFSAEAQGEVGNHETQRLRGMINLPVGETFAVRLAGAWTKRDGFDYNTVTQKNVNGRDLWATRVSALWQPTDNFRANFLWEHFKEDDDRSRTGKQLCTRGETPDDFVYTDPVTGEVKTASTQAYWTQSTLTPGCQAKSLYTDEAFGVPNGIGFPVVGGMMIAAPFYAYNAIGADGYLIDASLDPFYTADGRQSSDLREISTVYDPVFRAKNDVFQLNLEWDLRSGLTLHSQTLYMKDSYYGTQDFYRSAPKSGIFANPSVYPEYNPGGIDFTVFPWVITPAQGMKPQWNGWLLPGDDSTSLYGGYFNDPQLGAADHALAIDISQSKSKQWSQEFRLQSSFEGPFNFNFGANYLKFETEEDYYIISNTFTISAFALNNNNNCYSSGNSPETNPNFYLYCIYIDPNPVGSLDGEGHNYYRNLNIAKTESWALFGEGYWILRDDLRLTLGLRYTEDKKTVTPVPTQLLNSYNALTGGNYGKGYQREADKVQNFDAVTGRVAVDWKPKLSFTDDTLVYGSYSRGYKAGGANPRGADVNEYLSTYPSLSTTFEPEYVNAIEFGVKNSLLNGKLVFNAAAFHYDYEGYQISQVIDRGIHNENFDAKVYGIEFETAWSPTRNFRIDATFGFLKTKIADGEASVDIMDRLQGNDDWVVIRPWPTSPATCIAPKDLVGRYIGLKDIGGSAQRGDSLIKSFCPGSILGTFAPGSWTEATYGFTYDPITDAPNNGRGFSADLSGNQLPNAPKVTFNIGAQYRIRLPGWNADLRGDYYRQSNSYMRVYNTEYDKLKGWDNANLSVTLTRTADNLAIQLYVKNVFDDTPITDGFTGPDELGNYTNVFTLDPRIIGLSLKKTW